MKSMRSRKNRKKALSLERLESRQLFSAVPPHHAAAHDAGMLPDITVSSLAQFRAADFAHKGYDKVTIDNATGWFGHDKSFRFDGFDSLTVEGDVKDAKISLAKGTLPDDIRVTKNLQGSSIDAAGSLGTVTVGGSLDLAGKEQIYAKDSIAGVVVGKALDLEGGARIKAYGGNIGTIEAASISVDNGYFFAYQRIGTIQVSGAIIGKDFHIDSWNHRIG
ncbi:MAG: hypothetical protein PHP75_10045, partial [Methylacidiphilaceae bacterium]|nr:hypothetical protein [Candidatus Methylacidiphilaceae bacterium]